MSEPAVKQDINLLDQQFRPGAVKLSAQRLLGVCLAVVVVLLLVYTYARLQVPKLKNQLIRFETEYSQQQDALNQLSARTGRRQDLARLDGQIKRLLEEKNAKSHVVELLAGRTLGNTTGFSSYLVGLARQIQSGIWLKRITIGKGGDDLSIVGSTLDPKLVPVYLQHLSREQVFSGTVFGSFEMQRQEKSPQKVDFTIKTSAKKASQGG